MRVQLWESRAFSYKQKFYVFYGQATGMNVFGMLKTRIKKTKTRSDDYCKLIIEAAEWLVTHASFWDHI